MIETAVLQVHRIPYDSIRQERNVILPMSYSLRSIFAVLLAAVIILLTGALSWSIGSKTTVEIESQIGQSLSETSYQMADKLDSFMWSRSGELDVLSKLEALQHPGSPEQIRALLDQLKLSLPSFTWVGYLDPKGTVIASTDGILTGSNIAQRPVFQEGIKGKFIGDVHEAVLLGKLLPNPTGEPMQFVDISLPIYDKALNVQGVLAAHLSWAWAREIEASILHPLQEHKEKVDILVVSRNNDTVLIGPSSMVGKPLVLNSLSEAQAGKNGYSKERWSDGKTYLTGYALGDGHQNYKGLGWTVIIRQPIDIAYAPVDDIRHFIIGIGVLTALVFAIAGWFTAGMAARPLKRITVAAERLLRGEHSAIPIHKGIRDIEILSKTLHHLVTDLTKTELALDEMENQAHQDKLTGLPNRRALDSYLDHAVAAARSGKVLTFLYMDLDGFKLVNDQYGHQVGDLLLQQTAARIRSCIRAGELAVRLGGDEFLAVFYTSANDSEAGGTALAHRIIQAINEPLLIDGHSIEIGCSVGAARWPDDDPDPISVIRKADEALYRSKREGKNRVTFAGKEG